MANIIRFKTAGISFITQNTKGQDVILLLGRNKIESRLHRSDQ